MSPRRTAEAVRFLEGNFQRLVDAVTERQLASDPELIRRFGEHGRRRCEEDNRFHLHYLVAAITAGDPTVFSDYCGWVKVVLATRAIEARHLETNLAHWIEVLSQHAAPDVSDLAGGYLDVAIKRLPAHPEVASVPADLRARRPLQRQYLEAILRYDAEGAEEMLLQRAADSESALRLFSEVLEPAQREIGRLWQNNAISVASEHYATATAERILHQLSSRIAPSGTNGMSMVGLCPDGERHCLGLQMICHLARLSGWHSLFLGASPPTPAAIALIADFRPDLVAISLTTMLALQNATALLAAVKEAVPGVSIIVGGQAVARIPEAWQTAGAHNQAADAGSALFLLAEIARDRAARLSDTSKGRRLTR